VKPLATRCQVSSVSASSNKCPPASSSWRQLTNWAWTQGSRSRIDLPDVVLLGVNQTRRGPQDPHYPSLPQIILAQEGLPRAYRPVQVQGRSTTPSTTRSWVVSLWPSNCGPLSRPPSTRTTLSMPRTLLWVSRLSKPSCSSVITSHLARNTAIFDPDNGFAARQGTRPHAHHEPESRHQQCPQQAHFSQLSAIRYLNTSHRTKIPSSAKVNLRACEPDVNGSSLMASRHHSRCAAGRQYREAGS
jgi:hypothetical protein